VEEKKYIFKCSYKNGEHHCGGVHEFILNDESCRNLIDRLIFSYNLKVDKEMIFSTIDKFYKYLEGKYAKNQTDTSDFHHFMSIDMNAELLMDFTEKEFGKFPNM
jgi:hypothetical protein